MSKENIKVVKIDTDPAKKSVKDLRNEIKELKDQMANLEEGSDEFLELANKAGEAKHQIDEINESIKGASSDFGDMVGNVANVAAGLVGAFSAVNGALQAFGVESEVIDESIKKMQGLMAVVQGLGSIDTAIKSMDKLHKSITATTGVAKVLKTVLQPKIFLAISAAIAGLTIVWNKWGGAIKDALPFLKEQKTDLDRLKESQDKVNTALEREREIRRRAGFTEKEDVLASIDDYKAYIQSFQEKGRQIESDRIREEQVWINKMTEATTDAEAMSANQQWGNTKKKYEKLKEENNAIIAGYQEEVKKLEDLLDVINKAEALRAEREAERKKKEEEEQKKNEKGDDNNTNSDKKTPEEIAAEKLAQQNQELDVKIEKLKHSGKTEKEIIEETIKIEEERLKLYKENSIEYEKIETEIFNLKADLAKQTEEITEAELDAQKAKAQYELEGEELLKKEIEIETKRLSLLELESVEYWNQMAVIKELNAELTALGETTDGNLDKRKEYLRSVVDEYLMIEKRELNTPKEYKRVLEEIDEARKLDLISEEEHVQAKARVQEVYTRNVISQTSQVVSATSSLLTGLLDGLAAQQDTTNKEGFEKSKKLQIASATIQMLTGITTALAGAFTSKTGVWDFILAGIQAATIATTGALNINKIKQTKFDGGGVTPSVNASAINNTIVPPVQFSNAVQGAATEGAIKDTKVYVTETDIKGTMNKVSVQENENTY